MLLGVNTATPQLSLALVENGVVLAEASQDVGNSHSEAIFVLLETLFAWVNRPRQELTGLGVAIGPGGFTGLRTGLSFAKTIGQVLDRPVYGVSTLEALAVQFAGPHLVSPMLDARRGLVFAGLYRAAGDTVTILREGALYDFADWQAILAEQAEPVMAVGEGAMRFRTELSAHYVPPDALMAASAVPVALLAAARLRAGEVADPTSLAPVYLREPQAVVTWEALQAAKEGGAS